MVDVSEGGDILAELYQNVEKVTIAAIGSRDFDVARKALNLLEYVEELEIEYRREGDND